MARLKNRKTRPKRKSRIRRKTFRIAMFFLILSLIGFLIGARAAQIKYRVSTYRELSTLIGMDNNHTPELGSEIPLIEINLANVTLDEIDSGPKEAKYPGNSLRLTLPDNDAKLKFEDVEIKTRGNGTFLQEKKPYQIKFTDKVNFLGLGKARKWVLLANVFDESNLRTEAALEIMQRLESKYAFKGKPAELIIDGKYHGLYYVVPKIEIDKNSINLTEPTGILVELDNIYNDERCYKTILGNCVIIKETVSKDLQEEAINDFLKSFNALEKAAAEKDYSTVSNMADIESLAQYFILSELTANPDAYWTSYFFYKNGKKDVIHAGPGWDFDLSLGNTAWNIRKYNWNLPNQIHYKKLQEYYINGAMHNLQSDKRVSEKMSELMFNLLEMPEFQAKVQQLYLEKIAGNLDEILDLISAQSFKIEFAAKRDAELWRGQHRNDDVEHLLWWLEEKIRYLDKFYGYKVILPYHNSLEYGKI